MCVRFVTVDYYHTSDMCVCMCVLYCSLVKDARAGATDGVRPSRRKEEVRIIDSRMPSLYVHYRIGRALRVVKYSRVRVSIVVVASRSRTAAVTCSRDIIIKK